MTRTRKLALAAALVSAGTGAGGATIALASDSSNADAMEMQALADAKLSAADAMSATLAEQPGKVSELQFNLEKDVPNYEISILAPDGVEHDFLVDAGTGKVTKIAANEDKSGDGENEDGEDGDD
ncbi:PepSY domain-containing protein [Roseibium aggregatum]|uniref:PepSY domain-containing protein n=1 Tax=Roseibium aggregatum TaxID=187304 RepID=A0A926S826_9HYPH|nr:PepSY domain-containing protein [Roseibium aggregatum]MBD1548980.1 PepSY domain-containing protein [Roseibium aggregatum]